MIKTEIAVIGGGPAGLSAAISAAYMGARVTIIERSDSLGGQLIKQTHMFFGSQKQHAATRGIDIVNILKDKLKEYGDRIEIMLNTTVIGMYEDGVLTLEEGGKYIKLKPDRAIIATGASEKFLAFPNNDLPGIYGAGAVQTLMNVYGVKPGDSAVMVGAGNIGLIVSYQLMQAGVRVKAIVEAAPGIGGYFVHASKIRRLGVPIMTSCTVKRAYGAERLEGVTICRLDEMWDPIPGTETDIETDVLCISVGLSPLTDLLWQIGCNMKYIPELGGHVPLRNKDLETSVQGIYIAGDASGVEEASSAMVEGRLAGLCAARSLNYETEEYDVLKSDCLKQLEELRSGPAGDKIRCGMDKVVV